MHATKKQILISGFPFSAAYCVTLPTQILPTNIDFWIKRSQDTPQIIDQAKYYIFVARSNKKNLVWWLLEKQRAAVVFVTAKQENAATIFNSCLTCQNKTFKKSCLSSDPETNKMPNMLWIKHSSEKNTCQADVFLPTTLCLRLQHTGKQPWIACWSLQLQLLKTSNSRSENENQMRG